MPKSVRLLIDAARCPVKAEIYRLAARHDVPVVLVAVQDIGAPFEPWLTKVIAGESTIAEIILAEATSRDLVVTDDAALAGQLLARQVSALTTRGQRWTAEGPQPYLPEKSRSHGKARFETVLEDELRDRLRRGVR